MLDLDQRLGQLHVERPVTVIVAESQVVYHDFVAVDSEDPRPRAFRAI